MTAQQGHSDTFQETLRFIVSGVIFTLLNLVIYFTSIRFFGVSPPLAAALAYILLIPAHYYTSGRLVFRDQKWSISQGTKYVIALAISFFINVALVAFFWRYMQADALPAQVLSIVPAAVVNFLIFKFFVFKKGERVKDMFTLSDLPNLAIVLLACCSLYFSVTCILLYTAPQLFMDDWRMYNDYFFQRSLPGSIFGRQNGHLMVVPNMAFLSNYHFFEGRMSNIAVLNVAIIGLGSFVSAAVLDRGLKLKNIRWSLRLLCAVAIITISFCLIAPAILFWSIPFHNNLAAFAAVCAAYVASGHFKAIGHIKTIAAFTLFAVLAGTTFTVGAGVAALGFLGAILAREKLKTIAIYFIIGVVIGALSVGLFSSGASAEAVIPKISDLIKFVLAFLGNPFSAFYSDTVKGAELVRVSVGYGSVGILAYTLLTLRVFPGIKRFENCTSTLAYRFYWLLMSFAIIGGVLVCLGRLTSPIGMEAAVYPRFATWGGIFWIALAGALICFAFEIGAKLKVRTLVPTAAILTMVLGTLYINNWMLRNEVNYSYNFHLNIVSEIAINGTERPTHSRLWSNYEDIWLKIIDDLQQQKRNIYADNALWRVGETYEFKAKEAERICFGNIEFRSSPREDEFKIQGWILPEKHQFGSIANVFVLNEEDVVIGLAKASFGNPVLRNSTYRENRPWILKLIHAFRIKSVSALPGLSGHVRGVARTDTSRMPDLKSGNQIIAVDRRGNSCRLKP